MTEPASFDPLIDAVPSRYVVGIDLGTTNSAVTYIDTEESPWKIRVLTIPQLVAAGQTESLDTLPSFYFQPVKTDQNAPQRPATQSKSAPDGPAVSQVRPVDASSSGSGLRLPWDKKTPTFCVGSFARDETAKTSGRGIASAKSWLCHSAVDRTAELLPWHAVEGVKRLSPVDVSGQFLRHIRKAWDQQFADNPLAEQDIVLTLPASFDEVARELTVEAAAVAGLSRVVLIEEPQAAFYAWVYKHDSDWDTRVQIGQKILVCDIGGGTTDFTLIRVRKNESVNADQQVVDQQVQFHRVAVGNHLILGGDNLDLAIAKYLEQKLTGGGKLEAYQWDVLVGSSRNVKEQMLSNTGPDQITISLPSRGSKLVGGSLTTEVTREEIQTLIVNGFLPASGLDDQPQRHASGFQEFGLPYASDAAITRYLAEFLTTHADAGEPADSKDAASSDSVSADSVSADAVSADSVSADSVSADRARPDVVLFNGGFFASPVLRQTVIDRLTGWFHAEPVVLENDRLDLAVARGAAYYGMVRRNLGVRIAASLARSYYIGIGDNQAVCIMPGSAQPGQTFTLTDRTFLLTISQPVEFSLFVSSIRLADQPGQILTIDSEQMTALPPIRTVLRAKSRNEKREVSVHLQIGLTEIGTIDLSCQETESDRSWKLQFDIRSTTQTDVAVHQGVGEAEGFVDESTWQQCEQCIADVFDPARSGDPKELIKRLSDVLDTDRFQWPMSLLRRIWESLMERELPTEGSSSEEKIKSGRRKSSRHEARWLNLLGFSLRPGYGVALDDWRVTETWRTVRNKLIHGSPNIHTESLILWRRLGGGLSRGQQAALAEPLLASLRALAKQMAGQPVKGSAVPLRPEESVEVWRLLGSLELLNETRKLELGNLITRYQGKPKLKKARNAMIWALGRLGQRSPMYGPLNSVVNARQAAEWVDAIIRASNANSIAANSTAANSTAANSAVEHLAVVQMARRTDDRYRDLDEATRADVIAWLVVQNAASHLIDLVRVGGTFDAEEQSQVFGESLPPGLRML